VCVGDAPDDGESDSGAAVGGGVAVLQDVAPLVGQDARTVVGDVEPAAVRERADANRR
jgi:hypothetical protein